MTDQIIVCDHFGSQHPEQPMGELILSYIADVPGADELGKVYADFNALHWAWQARRHERIGFFGRRKYIFFPESGIAYEPTPWGPDGWYDATYKEFNKYRVWLSNTDFVAEEIKRLLAMFDMIVTPPWDMTVTLMDDFAA